MERWENELDALIYRAVPPLATSLVSYLSHCSLLQWEKNEKKAAQQRNISE
jgi:hypothetical protein